MFSFHLSKCLGMEFLLYMKYALTFIRDCQPFSKLAVTFCFLTGLWEFQLLCILVSTWYCQLFMVCFLIYLYHSNRCTVWYPAVILICFSLMFLIYPCSVLHHVPIKNMAHVGHLGGSIGRAPNSWFWLMSWSQSHGIEPCIAFHTEHGACWGFSLRSSAPLPCSHMCSLSLPLSLSQIKNKKNKTFLKI